MGENETLEKKNIKQEMITVLRSKRPKGPLALLFFSLSKGIGQEQGSRCIQ